MKMFSVPGFQRWKHFKDVMGDTVTEWTTSKADPFICLCELLLNASQVYCWTINALKKGNE